MENNSIESSFCYKYLTQFIGINGQTIESLYNNDYQSIHSLMAFDLNLDLNQLPDVSMGQKSILRTALLRLKQEFVQWMGEESTPITTPNTPNDCALNSTPIRDQKKRFDAFVSNDDSFNQFIETALKDSFSSKLLSPSLPNKTEVSDQQLNDSGINGHESEVLNQSPAKRTRQSFGKSIDVLNKSNENNKNLETTPKRKRIKKSEKVSENENKKTENDSKHKKRRKKFLYYPKRTYNRSKHEDQVMEDNGKTDENRCLFIDIDNESTEMTTESIDKLTNGDNISGPKGSVGHELKELMTGDEDKATVGPDSVTHLKDDIEINEMNSQVIKEKTKTNKKKSKQRKSSLETNYEIWKDKKPEISGLLKNSSDRIKLIEDWEVLKNLSHSFKTVVLDDVISPFVCCNACIAAKKYRIFCSLNSKNLKLHSIACTHESALRDSNSDLKSSETELESEVNPKPKRILESDVETETEITDQNKTQMKDEKQNGRSKKQKNVFNSLTEEELMKTISMPQVFVEPLKFDFNAINNYSVDLSDSENKTKIVVKNYTKTMNELNRKKTLKESAKRYRCDYDNCQFAAIYPFSLEQHKLGHKTETERAEKVCTNKPNKLRPKLLKEYSVLKGMNNIIQTHINRSNVFPNRDSFEANHSLISRDESTCISKTDANMSSNAESFSCESCDSNIAFNSSDLLNEHTINNHSNNQSFECRSPECKYKTKYKLSLKKHLLNNHFNDFEQHISCEANEHNIEPNYDRSGSSVKQKIVNKIHQLIKTFK